MESVLAFVEDKDRAIAECVRVTRPGGWVGMNEAVWIGERPPLEVAAQGDVLGTWLPTREEWQARWDGSGLADRSFEVHPLEIGAETRSRIEWIGWRWLVPAWGRALRLVVSGSGDPSGHPHAAVLPARAGHPDGLRPVRGSPGVERQTASREPPHRRIGSRSCRGRGSAAA